VMTQPERETTYDDKSDDPNVYRINKGKDVVRLANPPLFFYFCSLRLA
jgi:hypothetical protein